MMTTLLDLLSALGQATCQPVWVPVLAWTVLVLPLWGLLERTDRLHPHAEYRLYQVLLAALPVGMLATTLFDGWWTSTTGLPDTGLSVVVMPPVEPTVQSSAATPSLTWIHAVGLVTVAALGMGVVGLGRLVIDAVALIHVRAGEGSGSPSTDMHATADRMARRLGVSRPVRIRIAPDAAVPVTLGGRSPTVLLPPSLLDRPDALRMTLAHEFVHIRRYDDLVHLVERTLGAFFTAHPLVGRLTNRITEARERACDAAVLADANTSPPAYARLLATFADEQAPRLGTLTLSESPSSLPNRLRAMQSSVSRWLSSPFSLIACLLTVGLAVTFGIVACSDSVGPSATSQSGSPTPAKEKTSDEVFVEVEQRPDCGGVRALSEKVQYPDLAREAGIEGRVFVQFIVDENGDVIDPKITKGVHESLDQAALGAVKTLDCKPGRQRGTPVKVKMALPVTFKLPSDSSSDGSASASDAAGLDAIAHYYSQGQPQSQVVNLSRKTRKDLHTGISYPALTRKAGIEDKVMIRFRVNSDGRATNLQVANSQYENLGGAHDAHVSSAKQTIRQVRFTPKDPSQELAGKEIGVQFEFGRSDRGS